MKTIELQQFFYGRDVLRDYCMLASSIDDAEMMNRVKETCESYQSPFAGGLPGPVLMTKIVGSCVFFDCIRNGQKDPSGRGTIFHHVLVGDFDALKGSGIDAFELFSRGRFAEELPETKGHVPTVTIGAKSPRAASVMSIKLPAAVETGGSDIELFQRILGDHSNCISWVTYASRDMPGFELIGVQADTRTSARRWRYDSELNVVASPSFGQETQRAEKHAMAQTSNIDSVLSPSEQPKSSREKSASGLLWMSIVANIILAVALVFNFGHTKSVREQNEQQPSSNNLGQGSSVTRQITIDELRYKLTQKFDESYPDGRLTSEEWHVLTKKPGPLYPFTDNGWNMLPDIQRKRLESNRASMLKVLSYVEFMNNSILNNFQGTNIGAKK